MNKVEIKIEGENLLRILSEYYSKLLGKKIDILSKVEKEATGLYEDESIEYKTIFYYIETSQYLCCEVKQTNYFSEEDIQEALARIFNRENYYLQDVKYNYESEDHESYLYAWREERLNSIELVFFPSMNKGYSRKLV